MHEVKRLAYFRVQIREIGKNGLKPQQIANHVRQNKGIKVEFSNVFLTSRGSSRAPFGVLSLERCDLDLTLFYTGRASERNFSRGYEGRYRAPKSYWAPQALLGPIP